MWYREILAAREIVDPKGERTVHQTKEMYARPTFIFDDPDASGSAQGLGTATQAFGPGHYTSQNPIVSGGYAKSLPKRRNERLPKGTRILNYDRLLPDEVVSIIDAWNKKYDTNYNSDQFLKITERIDPDDIRLFSSQKKIIGQNMHTMARFLNDEPLLKLNPILVSLGYDAFEYTPFENFKIPDNLLPKKKENESNEDYKKRYNEEVEKIKSKKNILVINRAVLTKPRLFQKVRLRPDTVTPEEMQEYKDEIKTTQAEYYKQLVETGANITMNFVDAPFLLEAGLDPKKLFDNLDIESFASEQFNYKFSMFKKIYKYYSSEIIPKIFSPKEIYENKKSFQELYGVKNDKTNEIGKATNTYLDYIKPHERWLNRYFILSEAGDILNSYVIKPNITLSEAINGLLSQPKHDYSISQRSYKTESLNRKTLKLIDEASGEELYSIINNVKDLNNKLPQIYAMMWIKLEQSFPEIFSRFYQKQTEDTKVAYKIKIIKTAGKIKKYFYDGESKPLRDHLQSIFKKANSVDIYYMVDTLRRKAKNDDDISRLLLEADLGNILPGYQNKR
jgi:hypothetical protein